MSQVMVLSSLVRTCVIKSLSVQDRGVEERTGGGAGAVEELEQEVEELEQEEELEQ